MIVNIKKLNYNARIPTRGSSCAAGYDLYACLDQSADAGKKVIPPNQTRKIGTGIAAEIPDGYFGAIFARSGIATKRGLRPSNCVGVIDSDYRGEIIVALHNDTDITQEIVEGERIAQLVIIPYLSVEFSVTDTLEETERGSGGFGSTGRVENDNVKFKQLSLFDIVQSTTESN